MTSQDWGILISILLALIAPSAMAWVALNTNLKLTIQKLDGMEKRESEYREIVKEEFKEYKREIEKLWQVHNHQETRIYALDRVVDHLAHKLKVNLEDVDYNPKTKPHYKA